ncbi:MAG: hypothetical protein V8S42_06685 [Lachnospiraceae bacterium]
MQLSDNGLYELTAGNFTINEELLNDAGLLGTRSWISNDEFQGVEECGQIKEMIELLDEQGEIPVPEWFSQSDAGDDPVGCGIECKQCQYL